MLLHRSLRCYRTTLKYYLNLATHKREYFPQWAKTTIFLILKPVRRLSHLRRVVLTAICRKDYATKMRTDDSHLSQRKHIALVVAHDHAKQMC